MDENSAVVDNEVADNAADTSAEVDTNTESKDETQVDDHLTPETAKNVEKFGEMSETERTAYLEKLNKGGRTEAVNAIKDVYGVELEQPKAKYTDEQIAEMEAVANKVKREEIASKWLSSRGVKTDASKALLSKEFLQAFHSDELKGLPVEARTELALSRSMDSRLPDAEKRVKASLSTGKLNAESKEQVNPESFITALSGYRG